MKNEVSGQNRKGIFEIVKGKFQSQFFNVVDLLAV